MNPGVGFVLVLWQLNFAVLSSLLYALMEQGSLFHESRPHSVKYSTVHTWSVVWTVQ